MIIWIIIFSLFNHFFLAKTPEEAVFVFEVTCSHAFPPPTAGCFPHYKAGAGGWGPAARQYPSSSTDPPNTGIPRTGPYHPPPQPTLIPYFPDISHFHQSRCSKKCIIQLQQNSKLHALSKIHSSDKVSWQIWLLAYIPRGLASRSWGRLIQKPPETHFMAQFCAGKWVLNIFDMLSTLTELQ